MLKEQSTKDGIEKNDAVKTIKDNEIVLFLLPNQSYADKIKVIAGAAAKAGERICYVSANKPSEVLSNDFSKNSIDTSKFYFVDCVTKSLKNSEKVVYVSSPKALTEINIALKKMIESSKADMTLFDSLSTLLIYEDSHVVIRFVHSIISAFRTMKSKGILISLKEETQSELIKDLNMFVDKVVELG
ncbi:MAG: ATPase domain-containing protein [Candidatus Aenigmatarchaeota archaeon]